MLPVFSSIVFDTLGLSRHFVNRKAPGPFCLFIFYSFSFVSVDEPIVLFASCCFSEFSKPFMGEGDACLSCNRKAYVIAVCFTRSVQHWASILPHLQMLLTSVQPSFFEVNAGSPFCKTFDKVNSHSI